MNYISLRIFLTKLIKNSIYLIKKQYIFKKLRSVCKITIQIYILLLLPLLILNFTI